MTYKTLTAKNGFICQISHHLIFTNEFSLDEHKLSLSVQGK